ncbi:hypothetical protein TWF694_007746 [Orbilia ellipsospora]|uniref:DUF7587 domain-containing protein n=1 Tax=Orbilia ellipsospora TaxID=2528407 RepID=A0AAV9XIQ2_9PEZI
MPLGYDILYAQYQHGALDVVEVSPLCHEVSGLSLNQQNANTYELEAHQNQWNLNETMLSTQRNEVSTSEFRHDARMETEQCHQAQTSVAPEPPLNVLQNSNLGDQSDEMQIDHCNSYAGVKYWSLETSNSPLGSMQNPILVLDRIEFDGYKNTILNSYCENYDSDESLSDDSVFEGSEPAILTNTKRNYANPKAKKYPIFYWKPKFRRALYILKLLSKISDDGIALILARISGQTCTRNKVLAQFNEYKKPKTQNAKIYKSIMKQTGNMTNYIIELASLQEVAATLGLDKAQLKKQKPGRPRKTVNSAIEDLKGGSGDDADGEFAVRSSVMRSDILYRVYDKRSHGINSRKGFYAGAFAGSESIAMIEDMSVIQNYDDNLGVHIRRECRLAREMMQEFQLLKL